MEITGRLTADAVVRAASEDANVVGFTIVVNDTFKSGGERREVATFFECSYWRNEAVAAFLKKGDVVQVFGRVGVRVYVTKHAEAGAALTFRVAEIKLFGGASQRDEETELIGGQDPSGAVAGEYQNLHPTDNLHF